MIRFDWCLRPASCASTMPHRVWNRVRLANRSWGGLWCQWREAFCVEMMYSAEGAKPPAAYFQPRGGLHPPHDPCYPPPRTQTQAPIDAHHPSSTAARTQADWLQLYNDDKSHKHCQRHSDSKKHPLKIHPVHVASYFKHSPTPHLGPGFLGERLTPVVFIFALHSMFLKKKKKKKNLIFLSRLMRSECAAVKLTLNSKCSFVTFPSSYFLLSWKGQEFDLVQECLNLFIPRP